MGVPDNGRSVLRIRRILLWLRALSAAVLRSIGILDQKVID